MIAFVSVRVALRSANEIESVHMFDVLGAPPFLDFGIGMFLFVRGIAPHTFKPNVRGRRRSI